MKSIDRFRLEKHEGPYEKWPVRSQLFADGERTGILLPGYSLLHQFETPYGFVLVTDFDCPYEETTSFSFISPQLRLLSCRRLGWMYMSFLLNRIEWLDDRTFIAVFAGEDRCRFTIRSWGIWYIRPRLKMKWLRQRRYRSEVNGSNQAHAGIKPAATSAPQRNENNVGDGS